MNILPRLAAALVASLIAIPVTAQEINAKLGTSLPDTHPQTLGARKFAEIADKKTAGRGRSRCSPTERWVTTL